MSTDSALSAELRAKLEATPVAGLSAQLRKRGLNNMTIDGVRPLHPGTRLWQHSGPQAGSHAEIGRLLTHLEQRR